MEPVEWVGGGRGELGVGGDGRAKHCPPWVRLGGETKTPVVYVCDSAEGGVLSEYSHPTMVGCAMVRWARRQAQTEVLVIEMQPGVPGSFCLAPLSLFPRNCRLLLLPLLPFVLRPPLIPQSPIVTGLDLAGTIPPAGVKVP